jgi:hypothetical protein
MTLSILFWVLMLFWLLFGFWREYTPGQPYPFKYGVGHILIFALMAILGWGVFGPPVSHNDAAPTYQRR